MPAIRIAALAILLLPLALLAAETDPAAANVQNKEVLEDGKLIKATVKIGKAGTYFVVGGYAKDIDAEFKFLKGKLSGTKFYEIRKVVADNNNLTVDLSFPIKALPPLVKPLVRVAIFNTVDDIPTVSP